MNEQEAHLVVEAVQRTAEETPDTALQLLEGLYRHVKDDGASWTTVLGLQMYWAACEIHDANGLATQSRVFLQTVNEWLTGRDIPNSARPVLAASRGTLMTEASQVPEAIESYLTSLSLLEASTSKADEHELNTRNFVTTLLIDQGQYEAAYEVCNTADARRSDEAPTSRHASLSVLKGNSALLLANLLRALSAYEQARELYLQLHDKKGEAWALERIALAHSHGLFDLRDAGASVNEAAHALQSAISIYTVLAVRDKEITARTQLIELMTKSQQLDRAVEECDLASARCDESGDFQSGCKFAGHAAFILETRGDYREAGQRYQDVLSAYSDRVDDDLLGSINARMSQLRSSHG